MGCEEPKRPCCCCLQGNNGKFRVFLRKDGLPFDELEVVPAIVENLATLVVRVRNVSFIAQHRRDSIDLEVSSVSLIVIICSNCC